ncbi:MAG: acyltransferase [Lachnospiraceae bacterium]
MKHSWKITIFLVLLLNIIGSFRNISYDAAVGRVIWDPNWAKIFLITCFALLLSRIHLKEKEKHPQYLKWLLFGDAPSGKRIRYLDDLRLFAVLSVILVHVLSRSGVISGSMFTEGRFSSDILHVVVSCLLFCNPLFIMLSGALLLPVQEESALVFYRKRLTKVLIPAFLYGASYPILIRGFSATFQGALSAPMEQLRLFMADTPHFWLIYLILGLYLITPLLRILLKHLSAGGSWMLLLTILLAGTGNLGNALGLWHWNLAFLWVSWIGIFLWGFFLISETPRPLPALALPAGILAFLCSVAIFLWKPEASNNWYYTSAVSLLVCGGLFQGLRRRQEALERRSDRLPRRSAFRRILEPAAVVIRKYSFSILIIHWYVLYYIVEKQFGLTFGVILPFLLTLFFSLVFAFVLDNTIVFVFLHAKSLKK